MNLQSIYDSCPNLRLSMHLHVQFTETIVGKYLQITGEAVEPGGLQYQCPANKRSLFRCRSTVLRCASCFKQYHLHKYNIKLVFVCKDVTYSFYGNKVVCQYLLLTCAIVVISFETIFSLASWLLSEYCAAWSSVKHPEWAHKRPWGRSAQSGHQCTVIRRNWEEEADEETF